MKMSLECNQQLDFFLNLITETIDRVDNQVIDIYNFVKNSNIEMHLVAVNLEEIAIEIFDSVKYVVPYPIELRLNIEQNALLCIDLYRLKIILNNLISNAVKYSRDNNAYVEVKATINEAQVFLSVSDNGEGIKKNLQEKVFEIYYRANNKTSGTGLGLFICTQAVRKLNGTIELDSTPGQGSTFMVNLPNFKLTD
jgi:signal transduction histidine kinase